jgi:hypothetical protein
LDIPPGDTTNDAARTPLIDALLQLSRPPDRTPYVNLHESADWHPSQIPDAGGRAGFYGKSVQWPLVLWNTYKSDGVSPSAELGSLNARNLLSRMSRE